MAYHIYKTVVIGSGTMGSAIAAHLANAGVPVTLLDIVPANSPVGDKTKRNKIVTEGWEHCIKAKPSNSMSSDLKTLVSLGNVEDDFAVVEEADWVIEAVVENLAIKQDLMTRIDATRKDNGIVSTNTSGIPVRDIAVGRSKGFIKHFLGTHFFNPPRYLKLLEVIPTADTDKAVTKFITHFAEDRLGKGVVICKDTPNFIGNRVAFGTGVFSLDFILNNQYTVEEVDAITGPLIGRPKTATFRLMDLVGIDVWDHVGKNLAPSIPYDKLAQKYLRNGAPNKLIETMIERKWLGNKTNIGFYKEIRNENGGKEYWPLDLVKLEHKPSTKPQLDSVSKAGEVSELGERLKILISSTDKGGQLVRASLYQGFQYAASVLPEIADSPKSVDDAFRWGFGYEAGPFELWDILGVHETIIKMNSAGYPPPEWVKEMLLSGVESFYQYKNGIKVGVYDVSKKRYIRSTGVTSGIVLKNKKIIEENAGATLYDMEGGVACVDIHTKMNTLDADIFQIVNGALERTDHDFLGLVISTQGENFSAGANLFMVVMASQQCMWDVLDEEVRKLQNLNMLMRYFQKPVVVAPTGLALGGGCEIIMHASRVVAASETYIGLVELGAGVIPAGGGTKEILRRIVNPPMRTDNSNVLAFLQHAFLQIGQASITTSAEEARQRAILNPADRIVMNRDQLLAEAKREVMHMAATGYHAPAPELIYAAGRDVQAALRVGAWSFKEARYISDYDYHITKKLAYVMCGGELTVPQWVSEQYILDLEREAFLSLCGEKKTQERMWSILRTGKPLRN